MRGRSHVQSTSRTSATEWPARARPPIADSRYVSAPPRVRSDQLAMTTLMYISVAREETLILFRNCRQAEQLCRPGGGDSRHASSAEAVRLETEHRVGPAARLRVWHEDAGGPNDFPRGPVV